jgi:hypothetical protein
MIARNGPVHPIDGCLSNSGHQCMIPDTRLLAESVFGEKDCYVSLFGPKRIGLRIATHKRGLSRLTTANAEVSKSTEGKRGYRMNGDSAVSRSQKGNAPLAIATGGLIAGAIDLTQACILFGPNIPLAIAGGLLGPQAFHGGKGIYALGVFLHFFIALSVAAIYYAASRSLRFLTEYPLICGLFFGMAVDLVMRLVVLPLSGLHASGPYQYRDLVQGLLVHGVVIGLPISYSIRRFAK